MRTILLMLAIASLTFAQRPAPPKNRQVLLDFRADRNETTSPIPPATQRNVLAKVFPRYLTDERRCNSKFDASGDSDPLAAARKAGQIVPSISDVATGSFTAPGQTQTLYVISVSECNASHADAFGTKRAAIFSGQQLVAEFDVQFKNSVARKIDLNNDGVDELLMVSGDMHQGTLNEMATLFSFQNGRPRVIEDFGVVVEDSCASGFPGSSSKASVLYMSDAAPGNMPKFTIENYQKACNTKRWRLFRGNLNG